MKNVPLSIEKMFLLIRGLEVPHRPQTYEDRLATIKCFSKHGAILRTREMRFVLGYVRTYHLKKSVFFKKGYITPVFREKTKGRQELWAFSIPAR
jgi:hypothetical protein